MIAQFKVLTPGPFTTVQDQGRYGFLQEGVPPSGMLDEFSGGIANLLVGNPVSSALLEFTLNGAALKIINEAVIAVTGGCTAVCLNHQKLPMWVSQKVVKGDHLLIGSIKAGARAYLAVSGGIGGEKILGSRSFCVSGHFGGCFDRPLAKDDILYRQESSFYKRPRRFPSSLVPKYSHGKTLRVIPGPQAEYFDFKKNPFLLKPFTVSPLCNRMGIQLTGNPIYPKEKSPTSIISEPVISGSIQVPEKGTPIILLKEQTLGGYLKIATVISADLPDLAHLMPGDTIHFEQVDLSSARKAFIEKQMLFNRIQKGIVKGEEAFVSVELSPCMIMDRLDSDAFATTISTHLGQIGTFFPDG